MAQPAAVIIQPKLYLQGIERGPGSLIDHDNFFLNNDEKRNEISISQKCIYCTFHEHILMYLL